MFCIASQLHNWHYSDLHARCYQRDISGNQAMAYTGGQIFRNSSEVLLAEYDSE